MGRKTPLFELHHELGARIVDFGGWDMPVQYASQIGEHHAVRRAVIKIQPSSLSLTTKSNQGAYAAVSSLA